MFGQETAQRPEVRIVTWENDELAMDVLPVHGFEHYKAKYYTLAHAPFSEPSLAQAPLSLRYIYFDGSFYRLSVAGYPLKFSVNQKSVQTFQLPKIVEREIPIGCLGVSQNRLHYAWDDQIS
ncbi:Vacuolar protein sorting-associated protein 41-like protein [Thalictrum thalictroides]|uniref:Vacuolar protein sorting-associated protein 41-like protein n=1 Tax=Thalictrum thalictroides TaxID=46969 RepID=A0A7J6VT15_THATH|nr:Vacuolar protein sorting-associated protein 41-like protein [Thalictrum thalictroides]